MRKTIFLILIFLSLILLVIRLSYKPLAKYLGTNERAGIRVESNIDSKVLIDNKEVGKTPFQDENLSIGEHLIELSANQATVSSQVNWQGYVKLNKGTLSVVNRELGSSQSDSSGEVITLEEGSGVSVISNPSGSDVEVDGRGVGKTPTFIGVLSSGEHEFLIGHTNYLKRSIKANLVDGYKLNLSVDLSLSEPDLTKISTVPIQSSTQVVVKQTPTGFLRVRSQPSIDSTEVEKVAPGDTLTLLEEIPNWDRVRLSDGKEGYVSSTYVDKKPL